MKQFISLEQIKELADENLETLIKNYRLDYISRDACFAVWGDKHNICKSITIGKMGK